MTAGEFCLNGDRNAALLVTQATSLLTCRYQWGARTWVYGVRCVGRIIVYGLQSVRYKLDPLPMETDSTKLAEQR
jgi:hypothetical protein